MMRSFSSAELISIFVSLTLAALLMFVLPVRDLALPASIALVLGMVVWITWRDIADFIIPDGPLVCIALVAAAVRLTGATDGVWVEALSISLDVCLCGGALLAMRECYYRLRGVDGIGFGDVKLAAVAGILVGAVGFAWGLFLASVAGLVIAFSVSVLNRDRKLDRLPFGALLAPACWSIWLFQLMGQG